MIEFLRKTLLQGSGFLLLFSINPAITKPPEVAQAIHPFKVVVVISAQRQDPMSYMITGDSFSDFKSMVILLKSWGIPFEIIRFDQQFLNRNMFLGPDGKPNCSTIIWDVPPSEKLLHPWGV